MIARTERQAPNASVRLTAFAKDHAKREAKLEQTAERPQERDTAIRAAHEDGLPMAAIARIVGMSHQRVSQIASS